jgi:hypothetical protein
MFVEISPRASVYLVLDEILSGPTVPPGAHGAMFAAIDELKSSQAPLQELRVVEEIAVELHKLEWALRGADGDACNAARDRLRWLAADLINSRICGSSGLSAPN